MSCSDCSPALGFLSSPRAIQKPLFNAKSSKEYPEDRERGVDPEAEEDGGEMIKVMLKSFLSCTRFSNHWFTRIVVPCCFQLILSYN